MRLVTRTVFDIETGQIIAENTKGYIGGWALAKGGPSGDQAAAQASMKELASTLTANYSQQFSNQSAILSAIKAVYDPILQAGINQFGFSKPEETALRTGASDQTANLYAQAQAKMRQQFAAQGGGNLPAGISGAQESIAANLAGTAAESEASKQLDITKAGYEQGRQNFLAATSAESGVANMYNPLGYASAATGANKDLFDIATTLYKQKQAASPWGTIGGLLGGAAGSFLGPVGASAGKNFGNWLGGLGSKTTTSGSTPSGVDPLGNPDIGIG